jgi:hypothetical protein
MASEPKYARHPTVCAPSASQHAVGALKSAQERSPTQPRHRSVTQPSANRPRAVQCVPHAAHTHARKPPCNRHETVTQPSHSRTRSPPNRQLTVRFVLRSLVSAVSTSRGEKDSKESLRISVTFHSSSRAQPRTSPPRCQTPTVGRCPAPKPSERPCGCEQTCRATREMPHAMLITHLPSARPEKLRSTAAFQSGSGQAPSSTGCSRPSST